MKFSIFCTENCTPPERPVCLHGRGCAARRWSPLARWPSLRWPRSIPDRGQFSATRSRPTSGPCISSMKGARSLPNWTGLLGSCSPTCATPTGAHPRLPRGISSCISWFSEGVDRPGTKTAPAGAWTRRLRQADGASSTDWRPAHVAPRLSRSPRPTPSGCTQISRHVCTFRSHLEPRQTLRWHDARPPECSAK